MQDRVTVGGAQRSSVSCMDGFGRLVETRASFASSQGIQFSSARTDYDSRGNKAVVANPTQDLNSANADCPASLPSIGSAPAACPPATGLTGRDRTAYLYDAVNNVTCTAYLSADGTKAAADVANFNGLVSESCDENLNTKKKLGNPSPSVRSLTTYEPSQTATSCDLTGTTTNYNATTYGYDALARLTSVSDAAKDSNGNASPNVTAITYDMAGHKTTMADPDMGHWSYTYDAAGNLHTQTDARGITTTLTYDALNRLTHKSYSDGEPSLVYTYDAYPAGSPCTGQTATGHLTQSGRGAGVPYDQPCYDVRGERVSDTTYVGSQTYTTSQVYDDLGQAARITYPGGEQINYCEDAAGNINSMASSSAICNQPFVSGATTTAWHAPAQLTLGSGQTTSDSYDYRARLTSIVTGPAACPNTPSTCTQNLALSYDAASNVTEAKDTTSTSPEDMVYDYDQLNRLKDMHAFGSSTNLAAYSYNTIGNMLTKSEDCSVTLSYPASGAAAVRPHAPTSAASTGSGTCPNGSPWLTLAYDASGNLQNQTQGAITTSYTFDAENRLKTRTVTSGVERYTYDAGGTLVKRTDPGGAYTVYIGGIFEETFDSSGNGRCIRKYYQFGGRSVAVNQIYLSGTGCTSGLSYLLDDHLGSASTVTDGIGVLRATQKYWPYGTLRAVSGQSAISQTDKLYTGQQQESGSRVPRRGVSNRSTG